MRPAFGREDNIFSSLYYTESDSGPEPDDAYGDKVCIRTRKRIKNTGAAQGKCCEENIANSKVLAVEFTTVKLLHQRDGYRYGFTPFWF